ncbi:hypothetical protein EVA_06016 [gut metagenome]|uniref:Uncharacterized protein n=1 Tax=gut metagenome TaxID=749906 RepID=J9D010_9ZZZZ
MSTVFFEVKKVFLFFLLFSNSFIFKNFYFFIHHLIIF